MLTPAPETLDEIAAESFKAAQKWAAEAIFAVDEIADDPRAIPPAVFGMIAASALHYSISLHADSMTDLADAIRTAGTQIAEALRGQSNGRK